LLFNFFLEHRERKIIDNNDEEREFGKNPTLCSTFRYGLQWQQRSDFAATFLKGNSVMKTIEALCKAINDKQGIVYPNRGYFRFADIKGDGRNIRKVYVITGDNGALTAYHNGATYRQTAANLRSILAHL
jgi:hypothetical protein